MSSVPVVGTSPSIARSVSSDALPSPFVPSSHISLSSGENTASLSTSVTTSSIPSNSAFTTPAFSEQSQQQSFVFQLTMSATTAVTTGVPSLADPSAPLSIVPLTSARIASTSSATLSATVVTSTNNNRSTTSNLGPSVRTTSSTPTASSTTFLSHTTFYVTTSSTPTPTLTSASNTPLTAPPPPSSSSQDSPPGKTDMPITTVLQSTTIFIISTNSQGRVMTSEPPVVTEVVTTTGSGGLITTITQAIVNPTLASNSNAAGHSSFFNDTGAVVGVFVVVGLASASIVMWILFALRHRQRMKRIEQDTAVEAAVAAAGLNRAPLDDDDDNDSPITPNMRHQFAAGMGQRSTLLGSGDSGSLPTSAQFSAVLDDTIKDSDSSRPVVHRAHSHPRGYILARTASPSIRERGADDLGSSRDRQSSYGHTPTYSAGSFEPLLANYLQSTPNQDSSAPALHPPQNRSPRHTASGLVSYPSDGSDGGSRTSSKRQNSSGSSVVRDEEGYTHHVLTVRNVPDNQSQHSL